MVSFGFGGGKSSSSQQDSVWSEQQPYLLDLYENAQRLAGENKNLLSMSNESGLANIPSIENLNLLSQAGYGDLLSGGKLGNLPSYLKDYLKATTSGEGLAMDTLIGLQGDGANPYLKDMATNALDLMTQNTERNLAPLTRNATFSGGLGGSRQGIAEGILLSDANRDARTFLTDFYGQQYQGDQTRRINAAGAMLDAQRGAAGLSGEAIAGSDANALNALGYTPNMIANTMAPSQAYSSLYGNQWLPYQNYSNIVQNPVVLGSGKSSAWNFNTNAGWVK